MTQGNEISIVEQPREIALLESARHALAEASTVDEIKAIRDKAEAARNYAKAAKLGLDIQNAAATVKLEAERKAGGVLAEMRKNGGQLRRGSNLEPRDNRGNTG